VIVNAINKGHRRTYVNVSNIHLGTFRYGVKAALKQSSRPVRVSRRCAVWAQERRTASRLISHASTYAGNNYTAF
jgi:hypothetical protein